MGGGDGNAGAAFEPPSEAERNVAAVLLLEAALSAVRERDFGAAARDAAWAVAAIVELLADAASNQEGA